LRKSCWSKRKQEPGGEKTRCTGRRHWKVQKDRGWGKLSPWFCAEKGVSDEKPKSGVLCRREKGVFGVWVVVGFGLFFELRSRKGNEKKRRHTRRVGGKNPGAPEGRRTGCSGGSWSYSVGGVHQQLRKPANIDPRRKVETRSARSSGKKERTKRRQVVGEVEKRKTTGKRLTRRKASGALGCVACSATGSGTRTPRGW